MDRTNYQLLSIVAIVAVTAIVAMYVHAQRSPAIPVGPTIRFTDGAAAADGAALTGNVVLDRGYDAPQPERARPAIGAADYDYDGDGALDEGDADLLGAVIARSRFCPAGKTCDVNADGSVDQRDYQSFVDAALRVRAEQAATRETLTATPSPAATEDEEFWFGAIGAPVE